MRYELTVTIKLDSRCNQDRVAQQFTSLFEFGTIRESIAEGLHLQSDPRLVGVSVQKQSKRNRA